MLQYMWTDDSLDPVAPTFDGIVIFIDDTMSSSLHSGIDRIVMVYTMRLTQMRVPHIGGHG